MQQLTLGQLTSETRFVDFRPIAFLDSYDPYGVIVTVFGPEKNVEFQGAFPPPLKPQATSEVPAPRIFSGGQGKGTPRKR